MSWRPVCDRVSIIRCNIRTLGSLLFCVRVIPLRAPRTKQSAPDMEHSPSASVSATTSSAANLNDASDLEPLPPPSAANSATLVPGEEAAEKPSSRAVFGGADGAAGVLCEAVSSTGGGGSGQVDAATGMSSHPAMKTPSLESPGDGKVGAEGATSAAGSGERAASNGREALLTPSERVELATFRNALFAAIKQQQQQRT